MKSRVISLWIAQILLAAVFGMVGVMKATAPIEALAQQLAWPGAAPVWLVRFIGISEIAGAVGLILPAVTGIAPALVPLAALGLTVVMALATLFHLARGEWQAVAVPIALGALAAFVAWGRTRKALIVNR